MKQKNQRGVILCIYLQYINFLVYHSYADIIALLIILESYLCNYYLCMIYVNKFFKKSKETKNKRMKSFLPLCITFLQSFTLTKSYCKDIAFIVFVETHDLRMNQNPLQRYVTKIMVYIGSYEGVLTAFFHKRYKVEAKKNYLQ